MGYVDIDSPTAINIYTSTFANKDEISALIAEYNANVENEDDEINYTDLVALLMSSITLVINAISYVLIAFVSVSLVVSSIMIGIITYISVLERTKEIGILRAIGASKKDISRIFNAETAIVGFASGAIGIGVTLILIMIANPILHAVTGIGILNASLPVIGAVILVILSISLTLIAGLIPSRLAAKKDPVVALRTE
jgi:putative ABC transport system permease protein